MNKIIEEFTTLIPLDEEIKKEYITLLELPDEQFKVIIQKVRQSLEAVFDDKQYQDTILSTLKTSDFSDNFEGDLDVIRDFIKRAKGDEELSEEKKDFIEFILSNTIEKVIELKQVPRQRVLVKISKVTEDAKLPEYAHPTDAGADVFANETVTLSGGDTVIVKTGIKVAIPIGYEIQIRPRSGLSYKTGLRVANAPGTIDSDYRGEVGVIMYNTSDENITIFKGDKIAQMVLSEVPMIKWSEVESLDETERGEGGFGSTGV